VSYVRISVACHSADATQRSIDGIGRWTVKIRHTHTDNYHVRLDVRLTHSRTLATKILGLKESARVCLLTWRLEGPIYIYTQSRGWNGPSLNLYTYVLAHDDIYISMAARDSHNRKVVSAVHTPRNSSYA
jgi:hypothetical protein